jgi:hypothetical protein
MDYEATGPQSLRQKVKIHYRVRADVGKFRNERGGALQDRQVEFYSVMGASATKAHVAYSGVAELFGADGRHSWVTQWVGEGDIVAKEDFMYPFLVIRGRIDTATRAMRMEVLPGSIDLFQYRSYGKFDGRILGGFSDELRMHVARLADEVFDSTDDKFGVTQRFLNWTLDGQWGIPAGERKVEGKPPTDIYTGLMDENIKKIPTRIQWEAAAAVKPPREDESRKR